MSNDINFKRIYFPRYMEKLNPLINGKEDMKQRFIFELYDIDKDNIITGTDLVKI